MQFFCYFSFTFMLASRLMAGYSREFLSIEQALKQVVKDLKAEGVLKSTGKTESYFRKCSDENDTDRLIHHIDSVKLDIECMRRGLGHPLLTAHQIQIERAIDQNKDIDVTQSLLSTVTRIGRLTDVTKQAMDPNSPGGISFSKQEKDKIYKALKDVEEKLSLLKLSIK